jgi:hypothetical protein
MGAYTWKWDDNAGLLRPQKALEKHFVKMVGFKGGCPGWWDEEKLLFLRSRVIKLNKVFVEKSFYLEWERRDIYI